MQGRRAQHQQKKKGEKLGLCQVVREDLFHEKILPDCPSQEDGKGNTGWTIFAVERPESLQSKWEPSTAGGPIPPTDLSIKQSCISEVN